MRQFLRPLIAAVASFALMAGSLSAQELTEDQKKAEQEFYESITTMVDRYADQLDLDDAQIFYADSILTHDYKAMQEELNALQAKKVANSDLYYNVQDKWQEQIYNSFRQILDDEQWAKYQKSGAERAKKNRDKRKAKAQK
ncbi:MAG: hypothetical protein Q4G10_03295 [Bacteroidia bacterium]|nr:hypothetical protein [Bacteroidia bacterium]